MFCFHDMQKANCRHLHKHDEMHLLGCMGNVAHILSSLKTMIFMSLYIMISVMVSTSSLFVGIHTWETMRIIVDSFTIRNTDWLCDTSHHHSLVTDRLPAHPRWAGSKSQLRVKAAFSFCCCCCCWLCNSQVLRCWRIRIKHRTWSNGGGNTTQLATFIIYGKGQTGCRN